ncbi:hypothetical protein DFH06DRAFT_1471976 [Mycena polygramma]|nr:hypothetical protein DFH06DRAFT_1471976 [Mycena polygramma]
MSSLSSPFAAQLGTNYCPKDEELLEIKALLVEPSLRLKRLDDEIAELQNALDRLAEERDGLRLWMDAHTALASPARRLPLDIVQEIFIACLPTHRNCVMSASEAPVLLGRICSSWRSISLSTPRLWARLHIVEPPKIYGPATIADWGETKLAQRLETTKMWLGRSGQCPLSISLLGGPDNGPGELSSPTRTRLLEALIPFAARWQHISFNTQPVALDAISRLAESDAPLLEGVAFHHDYPFPPRSVELKDFGILRSSRLTSFSAPCDCFSEALPLRWHQLRFLEINGPAWETPITSVKIMQTISMCPELRACRLMSNDRSDAQIESSLPVELKFLHTFEMGCENLSTLTHVLDGLFLPDLRSFTLRGPIDTQYTPSVARFLILWTKLESLEIESNSFSKSSLLDSLRALPPSLQRLSIRDLFRPPHDTVESSLDDDTLAVLTSDLTVPCPALQTLYIENCNLISDATLLRFITALMDRVRPTLRRVEVRFNRIMTLDILPSLQPFIENGLDVSLTYVPPFPVRCSPWQGLPDAPLPVPPHW